MSDYNLEQPHALPTVPTETVYIRPAQSELAESAGSVALVGVMCKSCVKQPHVVTWECGGCSHALKENFDFQMPTWAFCPWCGSKLVPPNAALSGVKEKL